MYIYLYMYIILLSDIAPMCIRVWDGIFINGLTSIDAAATHLSMHTMESD